MSVFGSPVGADLVRACSIWPVQRVALGSAKRWAATVPDRVATAPNRGILQGAHHPSRMRSLMWLESPRIPGTSWPIRSDCRTYGIPASSIQVWRPWRKPCAVSPGRMGSHVAGKAFSVRRGLPRPTGGV